MNIEIANRLVDMRKKKGLSQEALAEKLGISRQAVSKWERAESSPDTSNLIALAKLYGISLDELLYTDQEKFESGEPINKDEKSFVWETIDEDLDPEDISEYVKIGWDGVHIKDGSDEVHVGWKGIHIIEKGKDEVRIGAGYTEEIDWEDKSGIHISETGGVWIDGEERSSSIWKFNGVISGIIFCIYLWIGFEYSLWHPGWLLFLAIPIISNIIISIKDKKFSSIVYPIMVTAGFLYLGFTLNLWHPSWLLFLTIPIINSVIRAKKNKNANLFSYTMLVVLAYLYMGFVEQVWHPTWIMFLTIPIYHQIVSKLKGNPKYYS